MQVIALESAGCEKIYEEIVSGVKADRPVLNNLLKQLRPGDTLVVWKLDRLIELRIYNRGYKTSISRNFKTKYDCF